MRLASYRILASGIAFATLGALSAACGKVTTSDPDAGDDIDAAAQTATLTVIRAGTGSGTIASSPAGITCGADCEEAYPVGTTVTLTATATADSDFGGWSGGGCSGTATCVVTVDAATTVTATFALRTNVLTVSSDGTGGGTITSAPGGIDCGATCTAAFAHGTTVTLTATPNGQSMFTGWTGACTGSGPCTVTMDMARAVTATFTLQSHGLTVVKAGNGAGTVTSSPAGISCGTDCSEPYNAGTVVTLTATPSTGSVFSGWSGGGCTGTGTCAVTITAAISVTATFTLTQHTLSVTRAGLGTGTVTSNPAGINCGTDCAEPYNYGTSVTLTAAPATGSVFSGWSGGGCTGTGTCTVTVTAATSVTATFTLTQHTLSVTRAGLGTGTVTSNPAGINCGTDCSEPYNYGTSVTLTASPAGGSTFAGWSGGGCTGTGTCTVTVTTTTAVTATFNTNTHTISSSWACGSGVSCQDVFDYALPAGASVTVAVSGISGASVLRLGAFAPGVALSGANLLTGLTFDRRCGGQNASDTVMFRAATAGTYRIAVGRDWGMSAGASGNYTLTVTSSGTLTYNGQTANDVATGATNMQCGYTYTVSTGWSCGSGVSCQDVFDFTTLVATPVTIAVTSVTGASVVRMALFDGANLNTTNRLNGGLTDRRCVGQNASDSATSPSLPTGQHRMAIGRDWGQSAGASGTYVVTLTTTNAPLSIAGQTVNDQATQLANASCP
ncbi:MAG: hypothetical protein KJZ91_11580 [Myxococcales bacterium]|nr:hypothetical protein [Myxococcales bacterium]